MNEYVHITHTFAPVCDARSKVLILGSFPSVKSREQQFYYGNPQNRFWKVIGGITGEPEPVTVEEKKALLLRHHIAVWDVIESCDIIGSSDSSIRNVAPADIGRILREAPIRRIYANGGKAKELYDRYVLPVTGRSIVGLPSTSPANAAWGLERLTERWSQINLANEAAMEYNEERIGRGTLL